VSERERFFNGFHRSIAVFAEADNDLIVEHIVEEQSWADDLAMLLAPFDVFWVGLHAPIEEVERREILRGDRTIGEARYHLKTHDYCCYHIEVDSQQSLEDQVSQVISAWRRRPPK
jgi:chloramphenicol 3-O phosphotransferase